MDIPEQRSDDILARPTRGRLFSTASEAEPTGSRPRAYGHLARWLARAIPARSARLREVERAGRAIGRDLAASGPASPEDGFRDALAAFIPHDPDPAGCEIEVEGMPG